MRLLQDGGHGLVRVADRQHTLRTPDGSRRVLRRGLTGVVEQQPAEGLPPETGEHPAEGGKGGDRVDGEEERLPHLAIAHTPSERFHRASRPPPGREAL